MAMAMCSLKAQASPRSIRRYGERTWTRSCSCPRTLLHSSSIQSCVLENSLRFARASCDFRRRPSASCDSRKWRPSASWNSRRWRPSAKARCGPRERAFTNATTASTIATVTSAPLFNLQDVVPRSVIDGTPVLLGALVPVVFTMYLSKKLNLGLKKEIQVAVFRATAQLSALGFTLKLVFEGQNISLSVFFMTIMVVVAGQTSGERSKLLPRSKVVSTAALVGGAFTTLWLMVLLKVFPMEARYIIPATAFLVGNSMTVVAITLSCIQHEIYTHKKEIEAALALGATPQQAINEYLRLSLIRGLGPIFDHMKVSGLVTLPGAMTGMLMSGSHPLEAVKSSLVLLYMLVGAASLSGVIGAQLGWRSLFSNSFQLLQTA